MFDNNTTFQLQGPDSTVVNDTTVYLQDSSTAFVTFNLTGMPTGTYTVQATAGNSTTAQLTQRRSRSWPERRLISTSTSPCRAPCYPIRSLMPRSPSAIGNVDTIPPIIYLDSGGTALLGLSANSLSSSELDLLGRSPTGPGDILRPGESVTVTVLAQVWPRQEPPYRFRRPH